MVIARPDGQKDPEYLARLIRDERITDLHFVPSMLAEFLSEPTAELCTGLRRVETAGEALPVELAERFARVLPDTELHNLYGPTEGGPVTACRYRAESAATAVPIGPPVWNTRVYVLDEALRQVPLGVPGELYAMRRRDGQWLSEPAGADGRAVRGRSVRLRNTHVPHR